MDVRLIGHASVIVDTGDVRIWCDPWLTGKVFNESWTLFPSPRFEPEWLDEVDYLWISHEHPDHFNIPTLRGLPDEFKQRVTILFQQNTSQKMFDAFSKLGFPNQLALRDRKIVRLSPTSEIYCFECGLMDSCLGVRTPDAMVLNVNDAPVNSADCKRMRSDFGSPDILINQFSIAGYGGFEDAEVRLREMAHDHLVLMHENHRDLGAGVTIPFASFILFSCEDNAYVNPLANRPRDVLEFFAERGDDVAVLYPGDCMPVAEAWDSSEALRRFDAEYAELDRFEFDRVVSTDIDTMRSAFEKLSTDLRSKYPGFVLHRLAPVRAWLPDLTTGVIFHLASGDFEVGGSEAEAGLIVNSQPLTFAFSTPFGVQTLGVSARFKLRGDTRNWQRHRMLMALYNAEITMRLRDLFSLTNWRYLASRSVALVSQLRTRLAYIRMGR